MKIVQESENSYGVYVQRINRILKVKIGSIYPDDSDEYKWVGSLYKDADSNYINSFLSMGMPGALFILLMFLVDPIAGWIALGGFVGFVVAKQYDQNKKPIPLPITIGPCDSISDVFNEMKVIISRN